MDSQANVDPEELFRQIFGDLRNFGAQQQGRRGGGFGTIFEDFAQYGFGQAQETTVVLSFRESALGAQKEVDIIEASGSTRSLNNYLVVHVIHYYSSGGNNTISFR